MRGTITIRYNYRELSEIVIHRVRSVREANPFKPVYLLVRSNLVSVQLQRVMADRLDGIFNVRFLAFPDLIGEMERISGRNVRKLSPDTGTLIIEKLKSEGKIPEYFSGISERPGFADSILRTISDLAEAGCDPGCASRLAGSSEYDALHARARSVLSIFSDYRREAEREGEDIHTRFVNAAESGATLDGPLFAYGFYDFNQLQINLLSSISESAEVEVLMAASGENDFHTRSLEKLIEAGFQMMDGGVSETEVAEEKREGIFLEAPTDEIEAREIVRMVLEAVEEDDMIFRDVAIVYPSADCLPLMEETLNEAGIPYYLSAADNPESNIQIRSVDLLLGLLGEGFPRGELVEFLLAAPLAIPESYRQDCDPFDLWVRISAEAGITGEGGWLKENRDLIRNMRRSESAADEDKEAEIGAAEIVGSLVSDIMEAAGKVGGVHTWKEFSEIMSSLASRIFDGDFDADAIFDAGVQGYPAPLAFEAYARILRRVLRRRNYSRGRFMGRGVNLLTLPQLRGLSFRMVILAGLINDNLPGNIQQDPFLKDSERALINRISNGELFLQEKMARHEELELLFSLALGSYTERLACSLALYEGGDDKKRTRSYLLERCLDNSGGRYPLLSKKILPGEGIPNTFISSDEYIFYMTLRYNLRQGTIPSQPFLDSSLQALRERMNEGAFSRWDGVLDGKEALKELGGEAGGRIFSATSLESYARCPFAFFIRYLLGIEISEDPELKVTINPMEKGELLHRVLEKVYRRFDEEGLLPLSVDHKKEILNILDQECSREFKSFSIRKTVGFDFLWELAREEISESIAVFLEAEAGSDDPYIPREFEIRFGYNDEPVKISLSGSGREVDIRGKIDRIDLGGEGTFRIIDYKSNKPYRSRNNDFVNGQHLQLPIYLLGASNILGLPPGSGRAEYREVKTGASSPVIFEGGKFEEKREEFDHILETIIGGIENGLFFTDPSDNYCRWCEYRPACPASRDRLFRNKSRSDPRCEPYLKILSRKR